MLREWTCLKALGREDVAQSRAEGIPDLLCSLRGKESPAAVNNAAQGILFTKLHCQTCTWHKASLSGTLSQGNDAWDTCSRLSCSLQMQLQTSHMSYLMSYNESTEQQAGCSMSCS